MLQPTDGCCPDQACQHPLRSSDYALGLCPACDGMLPARIIQAHTEKIEVGLQLVENGSRRI